ncbi:hypothetical protein ACTMU2_31760, partial [Cupriavidus basilensis]
MAQARAGLGAATAALLPSASASDRLPGATSRSKRRWGGLQNATPGFDRYGNSYAANLGASWEVDVFGRPAARARGGACRLSASSKRAQPHGSRWRRKPRISTSRYAACRRGLPSPH